MSWFRKPVNIAITIGAAVLTLVALGLIVWGVTTHTEGGLLKVCWHNSIAQYLPEETEIIEEIDQEHVKCDRTQELVWPKTQIPITFAPLSAEGKRLTEDSPEVRALEHATADFNRQVGFQLFGVGSGLDATHASARFGRAFETGPVIIPPGAVTHVRLGRNGPLRGYLDVRSDVVSDVRLLHVVLLHELGHMAGLRHDDFTLSIMYPVIQDDWQLSTMSQAHVTDADRARLRKLYHPE